MSDLTILSAKAVEAIDALQERVSAKQWSELSRSAFVFNTTRTINALEDLEVLMEEMEKEIQKEGLEEKVEIKGHLNEINTLIEVLSRNKELEATRIQKAREKGIELLAEDVVSVENYSSLEQRVLATALKSRYMIERVNVFLRKHESAPFASSKATKNVLDVLSEKEKELSELREKFEDLRSQTTVARLAEQTTADIEQELTEFSMKTQTHSRLLVDAFELHKKKLVELELTQRRLEEKIKLFDELRERHFSKTLELVTLLKKERDYAKKLVLDIEGETVALRNTYTQKLLNLEQEKALSRSEAFEHFRKKLSEQESSLKDKEEAVNSLRNAVHEREEKIKKMQEQMQKTAQKKQKKNNAE